MVPETLCALVIYLVHYHPIARHPGQSRLYDTLRKENYWSYMANDVDATVAKYMTCARNESQYKYRRPHQLFQLAGPRDIVPRDVPEPLLRATLENLYVMAMTHRQFMLMRVLPVGKLSATKVLKVLVDHCIVPFGVPSYVLTEDCSQFICKFFANTCGYLSIKHLIATANHPQTNWRLEWYNRIMITRLRYYVDDH